MKYNTMKLFVGLFVIGLFSTLFIALFLLFKEKGIFEKRYNYNFETTSAEYLSVGMPLKFSGFQIAAIDTIELRDDGSVFTTFSVKKRNKKWFNEGSVLMIIKPIIGSPHIEFYTSLETSPLEEDSTLMIVSSDSINDLIMSIQPVVKKALSILDSVNKITTYLASENSELKQILQNLNKLTTKLAQDDSLLTSLTGNEDTAKNLDASLKQTNQILRDIKKISKEMEVMTASLNTAIVEPASSTLSEVEGIMKDIKQKLDALDGTVKTIGTYDKDLGALKEQITVGIQKSNQIIDKVDSLLSDESDMEIMLP